MGPILRTIVEAFVLVIVGSAVAVAANSLRKEHSLSWNKNYFRKIVIRHPDNTPASQAESAHDGRQSMDKSTDAVHDDDAVRLDNGRVGNADVDPLPADHGATAQANQPKRMGGDASGGQGFQVASFEEVLAAFNSPDKEAGLIVFVDARADEPYEEGHIPGAIQIDHYQLDRYLDEAMQYIGGADKIIVYCNGGSCDDSIYVCTDLYEAGIELERIRLYAGGWQEWSAKKDAPIAKGPRDY